MKLNVYRKNKYAISNKCYYYADKTRGKRFIVNDELIFSAYDISQMRIIHGLNRTYDETTKTVIYTRSDITLTPNHLLLICNDWIYYYGTLLSEIGHIQESINSKKFNIFDKVFKPNLIEPFISILTCDCPHFVGYSLSIANYFVKNFNDCNKYFITDVTDFLKEKITALDDLDNWCERIKKALLLPLKMYATLGSAIKEIYEADTKEFSLDYAKLVTYLSDYTNIDMLSYKISYRIC